MARPASGTGVLDQAKELLANAKTIDELRQAQAVVLPLEFGMSLPQTAKILGVSVGWACRLRTRFIKEGGTQPKIGDGRGGRRRENMSHEAEAAFLAPFFEQAKAGGVLVVGEIKRALDNRLGRVVALASVYNLLHRHNWRKLAPDNGACTQIFLDEVANRHTDDRIIMVMDGAGWHKYQDLIPPENMRLLFLPPYAPELNPVEHLWDELREKWFHNRVFSSLKALESHLEKSLLDLEYDRDRVRSITSWSWIVNALLI